MRKFLALVIIVLIGAVVFGILWWPPRVRLTSIPDIAVAREFKDYLAYDQPNKSLPTGIVWRATGETPLYKVVMFTKRSQPWVLWWFADSPNNLETSDTLPYIQGSSLETGSFTGSSTWKYDKAKTIIGLGFSGMALDRRIAKVVGTTMMGEKIEIAPVNGFFWLWHEGSAKWEKIEAVSKDGKVLYTIHPYV